jgi:hypothetical protein
VVLHCEVLTVKMLLFSVVMLYGITARYEHFREMWFLSSRLLLTNVHSVTTQKNSTVMVLLHMVHMCPLRNEQIRLSISFISETTEGILMRFDIGGSTPRVVYNI